MLKKKDQTSSKHAYFKSEKCTKLVEEALNNDATAKKHFMTKMLKNDVTLAVEAIEKSSLVANTTMDAVTANAFVLKHGITIYRWREFITSFNNLKEKQKKEGKFLPRVFAPLDQVLKARAEATTHI